MFCAGGDPKGFQAAQAGAGAISAVGDGTGVPPTGKFIAEHSRSFGGNKQSANHFAKILYDWATLPQFTICLAQGSALGGGFGFLCICDMVVAVKMAKFVLSEVKLGVVPATISPYVISKIGVANAKQIFCTAENIDMNRAKEMGLVQTVVDNAGLFPEVVKDVASKIQQCAPGAVQEAKKTILKVCYQQFSESLISWTAEEYARIRKGEEAHQGMEAMKAKKRPPWMEKTIVV